MKNKSAEFLASATVPSSAFPFLKSLFFSVRASSASGRCMGFSPLPSQSISFTQAGEVMCANSVQTRLEMDERREKAGEGGC
jgi:hypothetical protein